MVPFSWIFSSAFLRGKYEINSSLAKKMESPRWTFANGESKKVGR